MVMNRPEVFEVMVEALQNHSARIVVVDELRDAREAEAARTIANQGVVLLASVHSMGLMQLAHNPTLGPPVIALTATCTKEVRQDVLQSLGLRLDMTDHVLGTMNRPNLYLAAEELREQKEMQRRWI